METYHQDCPLVRREHLQNHLVAEVAGQVFLALHGLPQLLQDANHLYINAVLRVCQPRPRPWGMT